MKIRTIQMKERLNNCGSCQNGYRKGQTRNIQKREIPVEQANKFDSDDHADVSCFFHGGYLDFKPTTMNAVFQDLVR